MVRRLALPQRRAWSPGCGRCSRSPRTPAALLPARPPVTGAARTGPGTGSSAPCPGRTLLGRCHPQASDRAPYHPMQNQSQEGRGKASEQVQMLSAPKETHGPLGRKLGLVSGVDTGLCGSGLRKGAQMVWETPWRGTGASTGDYRPGGGGTEAGGVLDQGEECGQWLPQVMLGTRAHAAEGSWKGAQRRGGGDSEPRQAELEAVKWGWVGRRGDTSWGRQEGPPVHTGLVLGHLVKGVTSLQEQQRQLVGQNPVSKLGIRRETQTQPHPDITLPHILLHTRQWPPVQGCSWGRSGHPPGASH